MKFIRSIIDERTGVADRASSLATSRTFTRVCSAESLAEDLVERLSTDAEDAPLPRQHPDPLDDVPDRADADAGENLFADPDADGDADSAGPVAHRVWSRHADPTQPDPTTRDLIEVPAPARGRSGPSAGRVKTRLLGFNGDMTARDPFDHAARSGGRSSFPVGWLVIVAGPGRGQAFTLSPGVSHIGRGEDQAIRLDFGDTAISRSNHAAVAYDPETGSFYLGHGGKANMVRLNNRPVLSTEPMTHGAMIRIGETTLRFAAFCDGDFNWDQNGASDHASSC